MGIAVALRVLLTQPILLIMGALFGIMGLLLAHPIVAMIKVYLEERSKALEAEAGSDMAIVPVRVN